MFKQHYLDLDLLESPLISANPFGSILNGMPGSAIAEKIFNDPDSWLTSDDIHEIDMKDPVVWLEEELEKYHDFGDDLGLSPIESGPEATLRPFSGRYKVVPSPSLSLPGVKKLHMKWEGVIEEEKGPYLPIYERSGLDLSLDLNHRLSKAWERSGNSFRSSTSSITSSLSSPIHEEEATTPKPIPSVHRRDLPLLNLEEMPGNEGASVVSPAVVTSTSTTWSILELYGAPPTPRLDIPLPRSESPPPPIPPLSRTQQKASSSLKSDVPRLIPAKRSTNAAKQQNAPVRRLPLIPGSCRDSSPLTPPPTESYPIHETSLPTQLLRSSSLNLSSPSTQLSQTRTRRQSVSRSPPAGPRPRANTPTKIRQNSGRDSSFSVPPVSQGR